MPGVNVEAAVVTRYFKCQGCNLIFQNPRLSDKELDLYYGQGYYRQTVNAPAEGADVSELNRAKLDAQIIKKYVGKITSHLDYGCGKGYLLNEVAAKVKVGVELDPKYVKVQDVNVYKDLDEVPLREFELVSVVHVLEHLPYPIELLKKLTTFIHKDGNLVIEVPSLKTKGGPFGFAHLYHFEPDVLKLICQQVGLEVVQMDFTPHLLLFAKKLQ